MRVEEAVVQASLLLATARSIQYERLLQILGEGAGAECVYLQRVSPDNRPPVAAPAENGEANLVFWNRPGEHTPDVGKLAGDRPRRQHKQIDTADDENHLLESLLVDKKVVAVPIISVEDTFYGYLGIAYNQQTPAAEEGRRILSVVGDMLASYFDRRWAEGALEESEARYRNLTENHPDPILIATRSEIAYINAAGCRLFGVISPEQVVGKSLFDFISADEHASVDERLSDVLAGRASESLRHEVTRIDGEWRIVESFAVPVLYEGKPAAQVVLRDITERLKTEERYRTFIDTISEGIWHVRLREPVSTTAEPKLQAAHISKYGCLVECNHVMAQMLGVARPEDAVGQPLWILDATSGFGETLVCSDYRVHNWAASHAVDGDEHHFVLNASGITERGYLVGLWGSCTDVTENVELERHMVSMLEEQQQQIGRELHDGVGQYLTGVRMLSQVLAEMYTSDESEEAQLANKIVRFAGQASEQVRGIYYGLTPAQLTMDGLAPALEELAANTDVLPNMRCRFVHDGMADTAERDAKLHLYRIAQEAVNNALKHAQARSIVITFRMAGEWLDLEIQDDGVGLDLRERKSKSLGINSMYYRARTVGADLKIEAAPGSGTIVKCRLPWRQREGN
ncbi:MAG TPA: PAS domain S-box protein [Rhodothermales bacterium]|nr:PAS domain S-box protein [Rhodothermales bacterium]